MHPGTLSYTIMFLVSIGEIAAVADAAVDFVGELKLDTDAPDGGASSRLGEGGILGDPSRPLLTELP